MRFRPSGGLGKQKKKRPHQAAAQARAIAVGKAEPNDDSIFDQSRHAREIQRAENIAAEMPPDAIDAGSQKQDSKSFASEKASKKLRRKRNRRPQPKNRKEKEEVPFAPVPIQEERPKGIVSSLRAAADTVISKVKEIVRPEPRVHKELIVNSESLETRMAILVEGRLEDFNIERTHDERLVGSIYKGRVKNLEDGLNAAFVDIGLGKKNAFLHYWDIVPSYFDSSVEIVDRGAKKQPPQKITPEDIARLCPVGKEIVVQATKAAIGTKGPRVTTNLALPGRYLVLLPQCEQSGVSGKIESREERQRLKRIVKKLTLPEGMGVVIRTAGQGQKTRYFVRDLAILLEEWNQIQEAIDAQPAPKCVRQEPNLVERTIRDFLTEDFERIVVDTSAEYERIRSKIGRISERAAAKVKLYRESIPIFDRFGISRQIESAYSRKVNLKSGGYIIIDETEALVAIDVNTGRHKNSPEDSESTIYKVNLEAAEEICRQLRLRNMGGLIILDFIDMQSRKEQQNIYQRVKECLQKDKAKTYVLPISRLGLMEMTRQRITESMKATAYDDCPYCLGRGHVKSPLTMSVEIQRKVSAILKRRRHDTSDYQLTIVVNPTVYHRLLNEDEKFIVNLEKQYIGKLLFRSNPDLRAEEFKILDGKTNSELAGRKQTSRKHARQNQ